MLFGALAFIAGGSAASDPASASPSNYGQSVRDVESFARQHDVSFSEARQRLAWQQKAPALDEDAHRRLGKAFGGVWFDRAGRMVLGVATPSAVPDAEAAVHANDLLDGVSVTRVPRGYETLERISGWLRQGLQAANANAAVPVSYGIRPDRGVVSISRPQEDLATAAQLRLINDAKRKFGDAITVDAHARRLELLACSYPYCTGPLRAGIRNGPTGIFSPGDPDSGVCTAGFVARGRGADSGNQYQLTAGHCAFTGNWGTMLSPGGPVQTIGLWQSAYMGASGDAGKYRIADDSLWNARPWVYWAGYAESYPVYDDKDPIQGQALCVSGAYRGTTSCGTVTQVSHTTASGQNLVRANFCAVPGDSGAPVHYYGTAYGLLTGAYSTCDVVFTRISAAENVMNVDVVHADAPSDRPGVAATVTSSGVLNLNYTGLSTGWTLGNPPSGTVSSVSVANDSETGAVAGVVGANGSVYVKQGAFGPWVTQYTGATSVSVAIDANGPLIAVLGTNGHAYAKRGMTGAWHDEYAGATSVTIASDTISGPVLGVTGSDGHAYVKQGLTGAWHDEHPSATSVSVATDRTNGPYIAVVGNDDHVYAKKGLTGAWIDEIAGADTVSVATDSTNGPILGVLGNDDHAYVKQGLTGAWTDQSASVRSLSVAGSPNGGPFIGILETSGTARAKRGLAGVSVSLFTGAQRFALTD